MAEAQGTAKLSNTSVNPPNAGQNPKGGDPSKATNSRSVSAPFQIQTVASRQRWLKALFYGRHGAGKTELAASAVDVPAMRDVLMVDAESGDTTLQDSARIQNADKIHHIRVKTFKQVAYVQEFLAAYCRARDEGDIQKMKSLYSRVVGIPAEEIADDDVPHYRTVILDSLTEIEVYCTYGLLSIDPSKVLQDGDMEVAGWPEFRKNNEMVKLLVRAFRDLPMHVIFTCAEVWTQDEQKKFHYSPQLTGKLSNQVQGFVDMVGWVTVGMPSEGNPSAPRRVYVQPAAGGPRFDAKNRLSVFKDSWFDNPVMNDIVTSTKLVKDSNQG